MVATADDMVIGGNMANTMIIRNETLINASCKAMGAPSVSTLLDRTRFSRMSRFVNSKWNPRRCRNPSAVAKLIP